MNNDKQTISNEHITEAGQKKPYERPELTEIGHVSDLTQDEVSVRVY